MNIKNSKVEITYNSPEEMFEAMMEKGCCRDMLTGIFIENCLNQYISYVGCNQLVTEEAKEYIAYALVCILNELKSVPENELEEYYYEPDKVINDVIEFGSDRGWSMDKHMALSVCVHIIEVYLADSLPVVCDDYVEGPALEQIVFKLPDEVINQVEDPVWERFLDKLLDEYDGDEDALFEDNDIPRLRNLVRQRQILPCGYDRM